MTRRQRSRRSYVIEIALSLGAVILIYLFLVNGGPAWVGEFVRPS